MRYKKFQTFLSGLAITATLAAMSVASGAAPKTSIAAPAVWFEVFHQKTERIAYRRAIDVGARFRLEHTHSVTHRPVVEIFSVSRPDQLAMEELRFDTFGPNLPVGPERIGNVTTTFSLENGVYRVRHHGRPLGTVPLLTGGPTVDHVVVFADGERARLLDIVGPRTSVELRVRAGR